LETQIIDADVCIIGAGPAGVSASITLSKNKIKHLIVDSAVFPRNKPCGDIMPTGVIRELNDLDPDIMTSLYEKGLVNPIWHTITYPPNGNPINIDYLPFNNQAGVPGCFSVSRYEFDEVLIQKIQQSEFATLRQGCRITAIENKTEGVLLQAEDGTQIFAKMILVATGSNNSVLKILGLEQAKSDCAIGIRAHYEGIDVESHKTELFLQKDLMPGGFYITPLPNKKFNVNLVVSLEKVKTENLNLREIFDSFIESNKVLKQKFSNATRIGNYEGSMLFLGIHKKVIAGDRFMIIGDSAGLIEIMSGNGIPQAFMSGKYAARKAIEALAKNDFSKAELQDYEESLFKRIGKSYSAGSFFYPALHKKWFSGSILNFLNYLSKRPQTNDLLRDLLYQKNPLKLLLNPGFFYKLFIK